MPVFDHARVRAYPCLRPRLPMPASVPAESCAENLCISCLIS